MKTKIRRKILPLLLAVILVIGLMPVSVWAVEASSPDDLSLRGPIAVSGAASDYQHIYYGGYKWRILEKSSSELFLLSEGIVTNRAFDTDTDGTGSDTASNDYYRSTIRSWLNGTFAGYFTANEKSAINSNSDRDKTYLLSMNEINRSTYFPGGNADRTIGYWWLRSAHNYDNYYYYAALVCSDGSVYSYGYYVDSSHGIRPAFRLNLSSVLFTSAAVSGESATAGSNLTVAEPATGDLKLTIKDDSQTLTIGDVTAVSRTSGSIVTVNYSNAATGASNYLCAELASGGTTWRGAIKALTAGSESGTASFSLPVNLTGSYTLRLWNEQYNAANTTNYACTPISKTIAFANISIASAVLPAGVIGTPYSAAALTALDTSGTCSWSAAGLPAGLAMNTSTGIISGTPTDSGDFNVAVNVTDGNGKTATATIPLTIYDTTAIDLTGLSVSQGTLTPGFDRNTVAYHVDTASGINSFDITSTAAVTSSSLTIGGQTAATGVAKNVTLNQGANLIPIVVTSPDGLSQKAYVLSVNGKVSNADLNNLTLSQGSLSFDKNTTGYYVNVGNDVTTVDIAAVPSDSKALTLINGSVAAASDIDLNVGENTIKVMVVAQDASTKTYTVTVTRKAALSISNTTLPIGIIGANYQATLTAEGGTTPYTWSAIGLPAGLSLDSSSGAITGKLATEGQYQIELKVTDANGTEASKTLTLKVNKGCGNGGYIITPDADTAYTGGYTDEGIPTMTVKQGATGFKYFSVNIEPVTGHSGKEVCVFVQVRNGQQIGINATRADFDSTNFAQAAFNVQSGDIIKAYIVDTLTNDANVNPAIL